jgi:hypothetical protein
VLVLPTGTAVSSSEIRTICAIVRLATERGGEITERLAHGSGQLVSAS